MSDVEAWAAFEDWNGSTGHYRGSEQEVAFEAFAAGFRLGQNHPNGSEEGSGYGR